MAHEAPEALLGRFIDAVRDVPMGEEQRAEVVINLAKSYGIDDVLIRQALQRSFGAEAADHPYFYWQPRARYGVGAWIRVVDGAAQALGRKGRITVIENPRRHGVRGMAKGFFYTVVLEGGADAWGFREEQLEETSAPR